MYVCIRIRSENAHEKGHCTPCPLLCTGNSTDSPGLWPRSLGCSAQCTFGTASSRSQSVPLLAAPFPELHTWTIRREGKKGVKELGIC